MTLALLRLGRLPILSLMRWIWLVLPVLDLALLRLPCLALLWLSRWLFGVATLGLLRFSWPTLFWLLACLGLFFFLFFLLVSRAGIAETGEKSHSKRDAQPRCFKVIHLESAPLLAFVFVRGAAGHLSPNRKREPCQPSQHSCSDRVRRYRSKS